jgi:hypothetical protein
VRTAYLAASTDVLMRSGSGIPQALISAGFSSQSVRSEGTT